MTNIRHKKLQTIYLILVEHKTFYNSIHDLMDTMNYLTMQTETQFWVIIIIIILIIIAHVSELMVHTQDHH